MKPGTPPDHRGSGPAVYRYHDPHDLIPRAGIAPERLRDEAGWEESDHSLVRAAARRLRGGRAASCADVGAGRGRLLPVLAEVADQVTVIEPDAGRLDAARGIAADLSYACWRFVHADLTTADLAGERFDLVVCSHVLQHLAHGNRAPFLACLRDMTAPGGLLVLMFSGTADGPGRLLLSVLAPTGETVLTRDATPAEFDAAAGIRGPGGEAGDELPRALPVWHAAPGEVEALLAGAGLRVVSRSAYRAFTFPCAADGGGVQSRPACDVCIVACPQTGRSG